MFNDVRRCSTMFGDVPMFGDVRCSAMFGDVRCSAMFGDIRRYYPMFSDVRRYEPAILSELQFTIVTQQFINRTGDIG